VFDDEKITVIESMPEGDAILNIWFRILCLAGRINDGGLVYLTKDVAYTDETLASVFHKTQQTIRIALEVFDRLGMVTRVTSRDGPLFVTNWGKHQNIEGMDRTREMNRIRNQKYRERRRLLSENVTVTSRDDIDSDSDSDIKRRMSTSFCTEPEIPPAVPEQIAEIPVAPKKKRPTLAPIDFDWESRKWDGISDEQVATWAVVYPALNIERELAKAGEWLLANPTKTKKLYRRFLVGWFSRSQERGGERSFKR
jgi:predicted phage replisome organizer